MTLLAEIAHPYGPVVVLIGVTLVMAAAMLILTHLLGPKRRGPTKDTPYESGVPPVGDARRRFSVRFYILAMLFLLFDVEVVFLWPWAPVLHRAAPKGFLLLEVGIFVAILLVGYVYAWRKGAFRWD